MWDVIDGAVETWVVVSWLVFGSQNLFKTDILPETHHIRLPFCLTTEGSWRVFWLYIIDRPHCTFFYLSCDLLLRTHWKPAVDGFRQKRPNKLVFLARNPQLAIFCCSIIDGPHSTHYKGNSIIYEQYVWDTLYFLGEYYISIGHAKVRIMNDYRVYTLWP